MDSYDSPLLVDSGVATPTLHFSDYLSRAHVEKLQASLSNSTSSETLHSPSKHVSGLSSPRSHSDDGVISNPSSGTSTPPLALAGTQHISNSLLSPLATPATLSASTSIQSLSSIASCSTSKRKAVPRRSLSMSESLGDPDIVKLEVYELFRKQPKRLLEEPEAPPPPQERRSEDRFESSSSGSMRRVNSLPQMTTLSSKEAAHDMDYSTSSQGGNGGAVQPRKRFYQKRTASPVDEEMDGGGYHMRLPPMIDTGVGYRDTGAEQIHSPLLASARSPRLPDSQNPLSPTTSYRDYSDADDDTIAAARELGSLKIFANSSHYEDGSAVPSSKRNRRGSSSSRKPPRGLNGRSASVESERGNALPPLPETWNEENGAEDMDENGSSAIRVVNRSNYPPVSGRGSEGAFQTTQHMPKGQIRSVLIKDRFRDTAGKNVAHWKCTPLRIDPTVDRYDELTPEEIETCENLRLLPVQYMHIKDIILSQAYNRSFFRKGDARTWFKMDVTKFGRLYDWFDEELGWFPWSPHPSPSTIESMREFGLNPKNYSRAQLMPNSNSSNSSSSRSSVGGMVGHGGHH